MYVGRVSVRDEAQIAFGEAIDLVARFTAIDKALSIATTRGRPGTTSAARKVSTASLGALALAHRPEK